MRVFFRIQGKIKCFSLLHSLPLLFQTLSIQIERFHSRSRQPCKFTGTKDNVYISKEISSTGLAWSINMAAFSLVWFTNMAAVTSMKTLSMWPNFFNEFSLYTLILSTVQFVGFTTDLFSFIIFSSHIVTC